MVTKALKHYFSGMRGRWFFLFHILLISLFVFPIFPVVDTKGEAFFFWLIHCAIIATIAWGVCYKMRQYYLILSLLAFLIILLIFTTTPWTIFFELSITLFIYAYAILVLLKGLSKAKAITQEEVYGVASVYLLMGFMWSIAYTMTNHFIPDSFSQESLVWADLLYYSFITLTTTGYGDIVPLSGLARSLSMLECVSGILFLAVIMSQTIAIHVSSKNK